MAHLFYVPVVFVLGLIVGAKYFVFAVEFSKKEEGKVVDFVKKEETAVKNDLNKL